jgi:hypothetical protein
MKRWLTRMIIGGSFMLNSPLSEARTIFSGTFIPVSVTQNMVQIGINHPSLSPDRICGIELKSHLMILNRRVWESVAFGLQVSALNEFRSEQLPASITISDGPRISYSFASHQYGSEYIQVTIRTVDGQTLIQYFSKALSVAEKDAAVIAVGIHCESL